MMCSRSGWPSTCQYRRTSFAAVSIASPPPVVRKILALLERRQAGEPVGQLERGRRCGIAEDRPRLELPHLRGHGVGDLGAAVPDVAVPEARRAVEVAIAFLVPEPDALAAADHELVAADGGHVRERMPEARVARACDMPRSLQRR